MKLNVEFYSDFSQLKYVFAEVITKKEIEKPNLEPNKNENKSNTTMNAKIKILEDEIKIIEETNIKLKDKNEILTNELNQKKEDILTFENKISDQVKIPSKEIRGPKVGVSEEVLKKFIKAHKKYNY